MEFSEEQIQRYSRHILLKEVGGIGQERLLKSKVLAIGAGGLGSPLCLYLAAAGVGAIGIVDDDSVDLSNLQRQVLHGTDWLGQAKVDSAKHALKRLNPDVRVDAHKLRLTADNALTLISDYDIVCDGSDNFATRFLVNDACHFAKKTLVSAAILRFDGQLSVFKTHAGGPCYRCIFKEPPPPDSIPSCAQAGVLGSVAGWLGTMQATETLKELLNIGESLSGQLVMVDALSCEMRKIKVNRDPGCPLCGDAPTIRDLSSQDYAPNVCAAR